MLNQLEQALYNHEQWSRRLSRTLIARLEPDPADLAADAHTRCRFGQWCASEEALPLQEDPAFAAMLKTHEQLHPLAAKLLRRVADGLPIPEAEIDRFSAVLDRLRLEINTLRRDLSDSLQNCDPLTGARNRLTMLSWLREQQAVTRRSGHPCALLMCDIDHFKEVNDRRGHRAGDAVLVAMTRCIQQLLRPYDHVFRYGGEEFLLCLPDTDMDAAMVAAERVRQAISALDVDAGEPIAALKITVSIGVALLDPETTVEDSIDCADKAMYAAKAGGRDRVARWPPAVNSDT